MGDTDTDSRSQHWIRQYPPLVSLVISLLIAFLVLPSSLNLPQSNPSTVLEFAPVPPEDDDPPPPQDGSLSSLGLGSSSSLSTDTAENLVTEQTGGPGSTKGPITKTKNDKRCVGSPPRQTEDPNSPPCVAFFDGDNGGATWQGVSKEEVTVLVYSSAVLTTDERDPSGGEGTHQSPPGGSYCDVDGPADTDPACLESLRDTNDHREVRVTRAMSRFFNDRFQTYGRHVHFWIYYTASSATAASRRSDAQGNWEKLKPFAVIDRAFFGGFNQAYAEGMVRRRASVYGNFVALENSFYRRYQPYIYSFWPDVEHWVDQFVSYVCQKVTPVSKVSHAGTDETGQPMNGRDRRYGLLSTSDPGFPGLQRFAKLAEEGIRRCPNAPNIVGSWTFPRHQFATDSDTGAIRKARENVAGMVQQKVTTVLWLGGYETEHTKAADEQGWHPEWVVAGDLLNDSIEEARFQNQDVWKHAWVASNTLREDNTASAPCAQAYREAEPSGRKLDEGSACSVYRAFFMLFKAIQVAGPRLSPTSVDQGQHAIPRQASTNPYVAACFYDPGDYTCVKDAQESWWDPNAPDPDGNPDQRGCWRLVAGGRRHLAGEWPPGDQLFVNPGSAPCNNVGRDDVYISV
ncbi:MAG TPA: hypothetical protein VNE62_09685 [Actinomycetota bacterium]|nr:hypothetical protein [Actinomycetota bacterium]